MKDVCFTLEFTNYVLANSIGPDGERDCFQRDSQGRLLWQQSWWYSAFTQAIKLAKIRGIKAGDIHMDLAVSAETEKYRRRYGDGEYRTHEAIVPGTKVTFEAVVADHVTKSSLQEILGRMGKYVGLSPYGYKLGYGRFNVVDVEVEPSDADTSATVEPDSADEESQE
jgi:hypothetical protein